MTNAIMTASSFCAPSATWSRPRPAGVSLTWAPVYQLSALGTGVAVHAQKRFTMAGADIDGWPLGPREGTSG